MGKVYNYKRVGVRKLSLFIFICSILLIVFILLTIPVIDFFSTILLGLIFFFACFILYGAYKKYYVAIKDEQLEIVEKKVPVEKIKEITIGEKRIDIVVEKGIFPFGTKLYMVEACFNSTQDWNEFKNDMEILKKDFIK